MCSYAEMYALTYMGKIMGYRIYATINDVEEIYDIQVGSDNFLYWCLGSIRLQRYGGKLVSNDEVKRKISPKFVTDKFFAKELLNQVQFYYQLREEHS